jgi:hypothetical protein
VYEIGLNTNSVNLSLTDAAQLERKSMALTLFRHRSREATQQNPGPSHRGFVAFRLSLSVPNSSYTELAGAQGLGTGSQFSGLRCF